MPPEEVLSDRADFQAVLRTRLPASVIQAAPLTVSRVWSCSRRFLSTIQGGLPRGLVSCCRPGAHTDESKRRCVFLHLKTNPFAPTRPGMPGLVLGNIKGLARSFPLFFQSGTHFDDHATYLGDYSSRDVKALTSAEWRAIPRAVSFAILRDPIPVAHCIAQ